MFFRVTSVTKRSARVTPASLRCVRRRSASLLRMALLGQSRSVPEASPRITFRSGSTVRSTENLRDSLVLMGFTSSVS